MKILLTGGAGFIGSHLAARLVNDGHELVILDNLLRGNKIDDDVLRSAKLVVNDVRDYGIVDKLSKGCSLIYHFAAVLGVDVVAEEPVETMETEVIGLRNITVAALKNGIDKIIYASTSGVYGHSAIEKSVTENFHLDPRTSYAIAKRYNEIYLAALFEEKGLKSISLRFFNVYGPKQDNRMVVPRFFEQAMSNQPITIFGDGFQSRDFTYIDDTINACVKLADKVDGCEIFNICHEQDVSIKELAEQIKKLTASGSEITFVKAPQKRYDFEVEKRRGNSEKLFRTTGFKPLTPLAAGLKAIMNYTKKARA